jgi:hypothetical protein
VRGIIDEDALRRQIVSRNATVECDAVRSGPHNPGVAEITGGLPYLVPGSILAVALGIVASGAVARWLHAPRAVALLGLVSLGVIVSATMTPLAAGLVPPPADVRSCDLSRLAPATLSDLAASADVILNIALFAPLGLAVGMVPASKRKLVVLLALATLPVVIEAVQLQVGELRRGCEGADVVDDLTGLAIGLVAGELLRLAAGARSS